MTGTVSGMSYHLILIDISKLLIFIFVHWKKLRLMEVVFLSRSDAYAISTTNKVSEIKYEWQR